MTLGIWCVEDEVSQDSPVWFIAVFVDGLDLKALGSASTPARGPPGRLTARARLVKLHIYMATSTDTLTPGA